VTDTTVIIKARTDNLVVLIKRAAGTPEIGIVTGKTISFRIDAGVAAATSGHVASSKNVVIGLSINGPAVRSVAGGTIGYCRQFCVTLLTSQSRVQIKLVVVCLPRSSAVAAFTLSILATGDGTVTGSTADLGSSHIIKTDIIVVLQQRTASGPEVGVVTGSTAIGRC
jgi:hypothetical protein